jgi:predicted kinase
MTGSRDEVAAELNALSAERQPLDTYGSDCTDTRYEFDMNRADYRKDLAERYLSRSGPRVGRLAILTAGPPGAGKTTLLNHEVTALATYRILDADMIKDDLIQQALRDRIYDRLLSKPLSDGHPISPRELAPLVHVESTRLIDGIRRNCVRDGENVVIEGTLGWDLQAPLLYGELAISRYAAVEVFAVEIDRATAHEQALSRWWNGRQSWISGADPLGGRFMPPGFIDRCYSSTATSVCSANALDMIRLARDDAIPSLCVRIFGRDTSGATKQLSSTSHP